MLKLSWLIPAAVEIVVVDRSQARRSGSTWLGRITKGIVIHGLNCGLIIGRARDAVVYMQGVGWMIDLGSGNTRRTRS